MSDKRKPIGAYVTYIDVFNNDEVTTNYFSFGEFDEDTGLDSNGTDDLDIYYYTTYEDLMEEWLDPASQAMGSDNGEILGFDLA